MAFFGKLFYLSKKTYGCRNLNFDEIVTYITDYFSTKIFSDVIKKTSYIKILIFN